jgi:hypothetical protein
MKEFGFGRTVDFTGKHVAPMVQALPMRLELFANRYSDLCHLPGEQGEEVLAALTELQKT